MSAAGARAAAGAAMLTLGGNTVTVRLPMPPLADTATEELGLPAPEFRDVPVTPCLTRSESDGGQLVLCDGATLETALGVEDAAAVQDTLAGAAFLQVNGEAMLLRGVEPCVIGGRAYLYRLTLRPADAEVQP